jgi:hypothetical protein
VSDALVFEELDEIDSKETFAEAPLLLRMRSSRHHRDDAGRRMSTKTG